MRLHIGGKIPHPDWKILDIEDRPEVDFVADAADLSQFPNHSIEMIYASHVLEHFHYGINFELVFVLAEWHRVLIPQGKLMLSVPNLKMLCWLYTCPHSSTMERFHLMRMIFGGHMNEHDIHRVGFDFDILSMYLYDVGFAAVEPVENFALFADDSTLSYRGYPISLNVVAHAASGS